VVQEAVKNQQLRLASQHKEGTKSNASLLTYDDVKEFKLDKEGFVFNKKSIGFKKRS
jgi:hypothetical protein